jgi:hypothetical protein
MGKLSLGLGLGVGYVLGAQAGRARYEQIKQAAAGVMERPEVQQALEKARTAAPAPLRPSIEKLTSAGSGRQGSGTGTDTGTGGQPPLPAADAGSPGAADASLADPLVPPARSVDDPSGP